MSSPLIKIYTDGGASPNPGAGGWGAVVLSGDTVTELSGGDPETTNNRMELTAAIEALKSLPENSQVELYTDSEYLRKGITEWMDGWVRSGRLRSGSLTNADLWQELHHLQEQHHIGWHWVRGHAGNTFNERAHELASAAIPYPEIKIDTQAAQVYLQIVGTESGREGKCGWAACIKHGEDVQYVQGGHPAMSINHFAIYAALEVLRQIPASESIQFFTTHSFLHDGITRWVEGWRRDGWTKPKFKDTWQALDRENQTRNIEWHMVRDTSAMPEFKTAAALARKAR